MNRFYANFFISIYSVFSMDLPSPAQDSFLYSPCSQDMLSPEKLKELDEKVNRIYNEVDTLDFLYHDHNFYGLGKKLIGLETVIIKAPLREDTNRKIRASIGRIGIGFRNSYKNHRASWEFYIHFSSHRESLKGYDFFKDYDYNTTHQYFHLLRSGEFKGTYGLYYPTKPFMYYGKVTISEEEKNYPLDKLFLNLKRLLNIQKQIMDRHDLQLRIEMLSGHLQSFWYPIRDYHWPTKKPLSKAFEEAFNQCHHDIQDIATYFFCQKGHLFADILKEKVDRFCKNAEDFLKNHNPEEKALKELKKATESIIVIFDDAIPTQDLYHQLEIIRSPEHNSQEDTEGKNNLPAINIQNSWFHEIFEMLGKFFDDKM